MTPTDPPERLNQIPTLWTLVRRAHDGTMCASNNAQDELLRRYGGAIRRYLLGALRDEEAADELFQEFSLRFVKGDLRRANPDQGRFRDYIKGVLSHMVADHHNQRRRQAQVGGNLPDAARDARPDEEMDRTFLQNWRDELLARAWSGLSDLERRTGQPFFSVLRFRADHAELRSEQLAEQLSVSLDKPITASGVRQLLHRAREKFADILLDDVAQSIGSSERTALEDELVALELLAYCRPALERRR